MRVHILVPAQRYVFAVSNGEAEAAAVDSSAEGFQRYKQHRRAVGPGDGCFPEHAPDPRERDYVVGHAARAEVEEKLRVRDKNVQIDVVPRRFEAMDPGGAVPTLDGVLITRRESAEQEFGHLLQDASLRVEFEGSYELRSDARVTKLGALLRRISLDELPQLMNVLCGNTTFTGIRRGMWKRAVAAPHP